MLREVMRILNKFLEFGYFKEYYGLWELKKK